MRTEHDLLGEMHIPKEAYYGIHSQRARENFPLSGYRVHPELIKAMALVKKACARANLKLGYLDEKIAQAVISACDEIIEGKLHDQFIVDALQGGAGTSTNMNLNEVIANRGIEVLGGERGDYRLIHPNNHVNLHQSTNDVYPTAIKVAAINLLRKLANAVTRLQDALQQKEREFSSVLKIGRTELQDAVPMTLGSEFSAYAEAIARDRWRVFKCEERLRVVNLGGTAIGTGLTSPRKFIFLAVEMLREETGLGLSRSENMVDGTQNADPFVEVSGILKAHAVNLFKIAGDLRLLSSGPVAGFREIKLPEVQAGSSIMPGKINPVIAEAINQVAIKVMADDYMITQVCQNGQLELNPFLPLLAHALLDLLSILVNANIVFREKCIIGITANPSACREYVERSWGTVTALLPYIGYEQATEVAKELTKSDKTVIEVVEEKGFFTREELDRILSPEAMSALGFPDQTINSKKKGGQD